MQYGAERFQNEIENCDIDQVEDIIEAHERIEKLQGTDGILALKDEFRNKLDAAIEQIHEAFENKNDLSGMHFFKTSIDRSGDLANELESRDGVFLPEALPNGADEQQQTAPLYVIKVPKLGENILQGKIYKWLKRPGDAVKRGDLLCIIETNEVLGNVHSEIEGTLVELVSKEGCTVDVGGDLTVIREKG
ncbi:bifunctional Biotin-lipoyl attachment/Single hybrid motif [Babesia duncani]|uniref:Bifunctional Biotin-lipoyl attachment/Single hybrid motif n=1 Tax=Babesia duncani TaxID=323732 RepID=A0AAD9PN53_9APIC|nr:bifunctional Biotin-lipoyl attachment/Single hybrid motif [Babesia duncani]